MGIRGYVMAGSQTFSDLREQQIKLIQDIRLGLWLTGNGPVVEFVDRLIEDNGIAVHSMTPEFLREAFWGIELSGDGHPTVALRDHLSSVWSFYEEKWVETKNLAARMLDSTGLTWSKTARVFPRLVYSEPREGIFDEITERSFDLIRTLHKAAQYTPVPEPMIGAATEAFLVSQLFRPGLAAYDLFLIRRASESAKKERSVTDEMQVSALSAARRLASGYYSHPIFQKKLDSDSRLRAELKKLANAQSTGITAALRDLTTSSLFIASDPDHFTRDRDVDFLRRFHGQLRVVGRKLDKVVTEGLLNRPYSKKFREEQVSAVDHHDAQNYEKGKDSFDAEEALAALGTNSAASPEFEHLETLMALKEIAVDAELSPRQLEVLVATMEGRTLEQEAERLGIKPGYARQELKRARDKIKRKRGRDDL